MKQSVKTENLRKGPWLQEEDDQLVIFVTSLGGRRWDSLAKVAGMYVLYSIYDDTCFNISCTQTYETHWVKIYIY